MDLQQIKTKYPTPISATDPEARPYRPGFDAYCVFGAYWHTQDYAAAFPNRDMLTEHFEQLVVRGVSWVARLVDEGVTANDASDFARAWRILGILLTMCQPRTKPGAQRAPGEEPPCHAS
jgi:hypothetical protein